MRSRDGVAVLFDSLLFLSVTAVVAVGLVSALSSGPVPDDRTAERVHQAHEVLLQCTTPRAPGVNVSLWEAVILGKLPSPSIDNLVEGVLTELLPDLRWNWAVHDTGVVLELGEPAPTGVDVYASTVRIPTSDGGVAVTLRAWHC